MKTLVLSFALLMLAVQTDAQYHRSIESQQEQIGKKTWISPPFPIENGHIVYSGTVDAPGLIATALFNNALEWYNYNYKTSDTRLTVENSSTGKVSGTGLIRYNAAAAGAGEVPIFFEFDIQVTNGKYSYKFYDMYSIYEGEKFMYADMYNEDRNTSTQVKPKWDKRYRYEILSDMNTMIEMSVVHLKQAMLMNSGVANN